MDPTVPWTYAYNRLTNAGSGFQTAAGDFQNAALSGHQSSQATTTNHQLILQAAHTQATLAASQLGQGTSFTPTGFLSPPSVGYDVFPTLFHHTNQKAAAAAQAAAHFRKQQGETELSTIHSQASYFDHQTPTTAWSQQANAQLPSPFGILPHESVVATTSGTSKTSTSSTSCENSFNAAQHFQLSINSQLNDFAKTKVQGQQLRNQPSAYSSSNSSSVQQSCIVSSANSNAKPNYRVPEVNRVTSVYQQPPEKPKTPSRNFTSPPAKQQPSPQAQLVVNKVPTKAELRRTGSDSVESQSSPISFALNYQTSSSNKPVQRAPQNTQQYTVINQNNYRYNEGEYRKTGSADSAYSSGSNGPDCNAAVPRKPSPLQAHSQPSPIGHASSPAYPIYNSPSAISQVTPPSPLDVTVSRGTSVAYPSVITRAEGRWEGDSRNATTQQTRGNSRGYGDSLPVQRNPTLTITERQQAYFDNTPVPPDLSACRGDPMTIVKNLHSLQNCNPVPAEPPKLEELRPSPKPSQKGRRKSGEKGVEGADLGRVPPPAHHNHPTQQQPQNGGYFDMERWNLAPPKVFGHNQGLIAPHPHHPAAPLPYFPPFHLAAPGHHPHPQEFHPGVEITPIGYGEVFHHHEVKEENPKVVVPNVEEELKYLSQQAHAEVVLASQQSGSATSALPPPIKKPEKPPAPDTGSGFMASYLKFLSGGDRDKSPEPAPRANRKPVWNRTKAYPPGATSTSTPGTSSTTNIHISAANVERKGNEKPYSVEGATRLNSLSKTGVKRSEDDSRKTYTTMKNVSTSKSNSSHSSGKSRKSNKKEFTMKVDPLEVPRRETSHRKAKEKVTSKGFADKQDPDDPEAGDDFVDSDTDPMWMPGAKGESDEEGRKKKPRTLMGKGRRRHGDSSSSDEDERRMRKKGLKTKVKEDGVSDEISSESDAMFGKRRDRDRKDKNDLTGEFVVMKSDMHEEYPPIWRIDGKTLLQKYEPFDDNGKTLYRNISTYSGWTAQNRHVYVTVPVRFLVQTRMETVVELLRDQMTFEDPELMQRVMKDLEKYQDSFEVYIQTLISQALDSNFLSEILSEQDDYFLSSIRTIDEVTEDHCRRLLNVAKWRPDLINSFKTFPAINILQDIPKEKSQGWPCTGCEKQKVSMQIQVYGQPYNPVTLAGIEPDPKCSFEKDWFACSGCGWRLSLFSKATHQKYLMYVECFKRVNEKREADPNKDTTVILNELLADESWLSLLFLDVRKSWAEIEKVEHLACESNKLLLQNAVASAGIS